MKRTWEKILAWISNVILILLTGFVASVAYGSMSKEILSSAEVKMELERAIAENPAVLTSVNVSDAEGFINLVISALKGYTIFAVVVVVVAILATLLMKKRILAGVLFLLVAIAVTLGTFAMLWFVGLAYLIVAILLFVRKEPKKDDPFNPNNPNSGVEEIKYI